MGLFGKKSTRIESAPRVTTDHDDWWPRVRPLVFGRIIYQWVWWDGYIASYVEAEQFGQVEFLGGHPPGTRVVGEHHEDQGTRFTFSSEKFLGGVALSHQEKHDGTQMVVGNPAHVLGLGNRGEQNPLYFPVLIFDRDEGGAVPVTNWLQSVWRAAGCVHWDKQGHDPESCYTMQRLSIWFGGGVEKYGLGKPEIKRCFLNYFCAAADIWLRASTTGRGEELHRVAIRLGNQQLHEMWD